ncbi:uncharacterized protein LOC118647097 [Monomorium pharaonis]|uniref:uncharacterized protein LOC118647097 n=1 Tax=Monomorium pharaonis TaxID=307658 RepID=UPI001747B217|nr:uncharacterized protein LOC118647097 [Monomorium pharaonis]
MQASLNMIEKIMEGANKMMEQMVRVSEVNLEEQRVKLRCLEVTKNNTQSLENLEESHVQKSKELELNNKKRKLEEMIHGSEHKGKEVVNNNKSLEVIKSVIKSELNNQKLNIKREYKLTQKSNFDLWLDYLRSELMSNDLLDVIDLEVAGPENLTESRTIKRNNLVRDIIINHLDEEYHKRILHERDSRVILKKLRGYKKSETNVTHTSVRARLYQMKMRRDEKVSDFCERFDSIIREYETCEDAVPLTEQEIRSSFYQAVSSNIPELRGVDLIRRHTNLKEMNIDEIKSFILQLEAEKRSEVRDKPRAQRVATNIRGKPENRCYRCNKDGHWAKECPLADTNTWFCYYCQRVRTHKGDDCPFSKTQSTDKFRGKRYKNKTFILERKQNKIKREHKGFKKNIRGKTVKKENKEDKKLKKSSKISADEEKLESGKNRFLKSLDDPKELISFIADSGATDHIVNTNIILSNFEKCENKFIKCANKNGFVDPWFNMG